MISLSQLLARSPTRLFNAPAVCQDSGLKFSGFHQFSATTEPSFLGASQRVAPATRLGGIKSENYH
jgi:hypothetical protein